MNRYIFHRIYLRFGQKFGLFRKNPALAMGYSSVVNKKNNTHIPILDYDSLPEKAVVADIKKLRRLYDLSVAFVYKTRNGHHVLFYYDASDWSVVKKVLFSARVDWRQKVMADQYGRTFIRTSGKYKESDIKFRGIVISNKAPSPMQVMLGEAEIAFHDDIMNFDVIPDKFKV